MLRNQAIMVGI